MAVLCFYLSGRGSRRQLGAYAPSCLRAYDTSDAKSLRTLYLRRSQETLISLAQPGISEKKEAGIFMIQRAWRPQQVHSDILEISVTLATVTGTAARDQIFPGALASPRTRNHMVE